MKIAFVIDKIRFSIPLGIGYLCAVLKKSGYEVDVFEIGKNPKKSIRTIQKFHPNIVGYTIFTGMQSKFIKFNQMLKEKLKFYAIFGGPHPTFFPQMVEVNGIDAVCIGEGERAFLNFIRLVERCKELPEKADNFWIKKNGKIFKNPVGPLITDLDNLPFPDIEIFIKKFPIFKVWKRQEMIIHRGCPYKCSYCFNHTYNEIYKKNGFIYRSRSPENICEEIEFIRKYKRYKSYLFCG